MGKSRKIVLIGPMGAGKSSLGRRLADRLRYQFYDTDHEIVRQTGVDIPLIFEREGEEGFRKREYCALKEILQKEGNAVVACGGGIVLKKENRELIMQQDVVVFLDVSIERQLKRVSRDKNRPLLQTIDQRKKLQELRDERLGLYVGVADFRLNTDDNVFGVSLKRLLRGVRRELQKIENPIS